jgi:hypothetical protein
MTAFQYKMFAAVAMASCLRAQNPLLALPGNYRLVTENETVRVIHVRYGEHQKLPVHSHSEYPTVYIYLTDSGPVRFSHVEKHAFAIVRPPAMAGTFRVSPGRLEMHEVENLGAIPTEFLRVEMKQIPLGFQRSSFRGVKPFDLTKSGVSREFSSPAFRIERVVSAGGRGLEIGDSQSPSLVVALSPSVIGPNIHLKPGEVFWMITRHNTVTGVGGSPAHLLRLLFP